MYNAFEVGIYFTEGLFSINVSANFPFSQKGEQPSFFFFTEKFMSECLDKKSSLNSSVWSREENSANISSV